MLLKPGKGWLIPENLDEVNPCKCRETVRFNYNITRICVGILGYRLKRVHHKPRTLFWPTYFRKKMTQNRPRVSCFFFWFFFCPVLGRSSLFGGIKVNEDDLHFFFFWLNTIFPDPENGIKLSDRSGLLGWRRSLPPKRGVRFAQKTSTVATVWYIRYRMRHTVALPVL